jgi:hypothetical protein
MLAHDAARLRPNLDAVEAAFGPDRPAAWWKGYQAYYDERLRKIREQMGL